MPLNLKVNDGDFAPYIKYNAKSGRIYIKDQNTGEEIEVPIPVTMAVDFYGIKSGWIYYADGSAPVTAWDNGPDMMAPKPINDKACRRGFSVNVFIKEHGLHELSGNSGILIGAIKRCHDEEFEPAAQRNQGLVPIVRWESITPTRSRQGMNYTPVLRIVDWKPRPASMPLDGQPTATPATAPPADKTAPMPLAHKLQEKLAEELPPRNRRAVDDDPVADLGVPAAAELEDSLPF